MPAKWQRWMPMEIDALRASPSVQAMHPSARAGYIWLLLDAWQTDDCTVPADQLELAEKSGLGDELWAVHGPRILRKFDPVQGTDRLQNAPQLERWMDAKRVYDRNHVDAEEVRRKRAESGKKGNEVRWSKSQTDRKSDTDATKPIAKPSQTRQTLSQTHRSTETETETETKEQEQKPSPKPRKRVSEDGMKHSTDPRHIACKEEIFNYYRLKNNNVDPDWSGREGSALGMFLSANPKLSAVGVRKLLEARCGSEVNHGDRPGKWISELKSYLHGPIDRFGLPLTGGNGNGKQSYNKQERTEQALREALAEADDHAGTGGDGHPAGRGVEQVSPDDLRGAVIEGAR